MLNTSSTKCIAVIQLMRHAGHQGIAGKRRQQQGCTHAAAAVQEGGGSLQSKAAVFVQQHVQGSAREDRATAAGARDGMPLPHPCQALCTFRYMQPQVFAPSWNCEPSCCWSTHRYSIFRQVAGSANLLLELCSHATRLCTLQHALFEVLAICQVASTSWGRPVCLHSLCSAWQPLFRAGV